VKNLRFVLDWGKCSYRKIQPNSKSKKRNPDDNRYNYVVLLKWKLQTFFFTGGDASAWS